PSSEVGGVLAAAIEHARRLGTRGLGFDDFAAAVTVQVQVGHEIALEICKLRALRVLWAKVAHAFGGSVVPPILAVTSGRFRAEDHDPPTNLVRTALAGFAAVAGGADAVIALPYDDGAADRQRAQDLARDQLHLLR